MPAQGSAADLRKRLEEATFRPGYRPALIRTLRPENQGQAPETVPASRDLKQDLLAYLHSLLGASKRAPSLRDVTSM